MEVYDKLIKVKNVILYIFFSFRQLFVELRQCVGQARAISQLALRFVNVHLILEEQCVRYSFLFIL